MAETLAMAHGVSTAKARTAGILHDLARLYPSDRLLTECRRRGLPIDSFASAHPVVLHAPLSAELARERFSVADREILDAIAKHTLGAREMSALDCVVFLADSLEPERPLPEREHLATLARSDLRAAMIATIRSSLRYLGDRKEQAAPQTIAALQSLEESTGGHR